MIEKLDNSTETKSESSKFIFAKVESKIFIELTSLE